MEEAGNPYAAPRTHDIAADGAGALPAASIGARVGARLLDGLVEGLPVIAAFGVAFALGDERGPSLPAVAVGYLLAFSVWIYQVVRLVKTGQTLGKKWAGVRVVGTDGSLLSFGRHFLRGLVLGLLGIISVLFIFRSDRRCLHDLAAESRVVGV